MEHSGQSSEDRLLDFHLDQLTDPERERLEADLLRDAALRHQSDRLGQMLRPLDHWTVPTEPAGLADRILEQARRLPRGTHEQTPRISPDLGTYRPRRTLHLRELLAVAASIALLAMVAYPLPPVVERLTL